MQERSDPRPSAGSSGLPRPGAGAAERPAMPPPITMLSNFMAALLGGVGWGAGASGEGDHSPRWGAVHSPRPNSPS